VDGVDGVDGDESSAQKHPVFPPPGVRYKSSLVYPASRSLRGAEIRRNIRKIMQLPNSQGIGKIADIVVKLRDSIV
jgi:hypothetical protein